MCGFRLCFQSVLCVSCFPGSFVLIMYPRNFNSLSDKHFVSIFFKTVILQIIISKIHIWFSQSFFYICIRVAILSNTDFIKNVISFFFLLNFSCMWTRDLFFDLSIGIVQMNTNAICIFNCKMCIKIIETLKNQKKNNP